MPRFTRIAYGLTGLLLLHLLNPTVAWLALGAGFFCIAAHRRRRPLRAPAVVTGPAVVTTRYRLHVDSSSPLSDVAMRIFHRTAKTTASVIMNEGFSDNEEKYLSDFAWRGVWVSDRPPCAEQVPENALLTLEIPAELFAEYEWLQEEDSARGSLIPAIILNRYGPAESVED